MKKKVLVLLVCLLVFACRSYGSVYNLPLNQPSSFLKTKCENKRWKIEDNQ